MAGSGSFLERVAKRFARSVVEEAQVELARLGERSEVLRRLDHVVARTLHGHAPEPKRPFARSGGHGSEGATPPPPPGGRNGATPPPPPPPLRPSTPPVEETVSVVLRRQVPIRSDEPPRSWIGGLPMMPDGVEWPRGVNPEKTNEGARPLHFVAQIACADLPAELWGGLGPREGWLLFFLDNNVSTIESGEQHRVMHCATLGRERRPPADIGQVHDGVYTGSMFTSYMDQADVPSVWRRWPVDLVAVPNRLHRDGPRSFGTPPDFAPTLYPDMAIGGERDRAPDIDPFSWRCLGEIGRILRVARPIAPAPAEHEVRLRNKFAAQGALTTQLDQYDTDESEFAKSPNGQLLAADPATLGKEETARAETARRYRASVAARRAEVAALIARYPTHEAMLAFLEQERLRRAEWRASVATRFTELLTALETIDPDTPLTPGQWADIRSALENDRFAGWTLDRHYRGPIVLEQREEATWQLVADRVAAAAPEVAGDYYVDSARRHLLPADAIAKLEPWWRTLYDNRPHKLGGYHDGVQSDATDGPTDQPLLLQLATDNAVQWCWGDAGAIYWFIPVGALAAGAFDAADCQIECH